MRAVNGEATTTMASLTEHRLDVGLKEDIHYWTLGEPSAKRGALVLLHGMRDVGRALLPVAEALSDEFYCVMPDLRGHGKSVKPGSYAIQHFLMDLRRLHQALESPSIHLVGHSLGGHISCRYAGLYPEQIDSLVVIEGLGPPPSDPQNSDTLGRVADELDRALITASRAVKPRVLPNLAAASARLMANNPQLQRGWADQLADWGTTSAADGDGLVWVFDPRAQEVFLGISEARSFDYWRAIKAPTLLITGSLGHQYWQSMMDTAGYSGRFSEAQLSARRAALGTDGPAAHQEIIGAGHQVHYDQPQKLAHCVRQFLVPSTPTAVTTDN